jgi:hypothetical protein
LFIKIALPAYALISRGGRQVQEDSKTLSLVNWHLLEYHLKDKAFMLFPGKRATWSLILKKSGGMLGDRREKSDKKKSPVEKKEKLGAEEVDGRLCDKMHIVTISGTGIKNDITTWRVEDLSGFPVAP